MGVDICDLRIAIGGKEIVHGVDLSIGDGERVGLIGSSGSGKSMIARAMLGLLPPDVTVAGSVMLGGSEVTTARWPICAAGIRAWSSRIRAHH